MDFNLLRGWICSLFLLTELVICLSWLYDWSFCYQSFSFEIHLYVQAIYDLDLASDIFFLLIRDILVVFYVYFTLWNWMIYTYARFLNIKDSHWIFILRVTIIDGWYCEWSLILWMVHMLISLDDIMHVIILNTLL